MVAVLVALAIAWPVLAQQGQYRDLSEEERAELKEKLRNMSKEEKQKFLAERRGISGGRVPMLGREAQLEAIKAIEEQLGKLKELVEKSPERESLRKLREGSPEEQAKQRESWQKARQEQQKVIEGIQEQLSKLGGRQPMARPGLPVKELKEIQALAVQENANKTAERIEKLISSYQREPRERPQRPERTERLESRQDRQKRGAQGAVSSKKAPEFTLKSFDGKTMSLSDYEGKIVVLEWFNFGCPFVKYHYDNKTTMVDLAKKYKDRNVIWLAMNSTNHTTPEANKEYATKHKLPYPILDDRSGSVGRAYGAKTTPHIFIIDSSGNIAYHGAIDNSPLGKTQGPQLVNYVDKALAELTAGKAVSERETKPYGCSVKYAN